MHNIIRPDDLDMNIGTYLYSRLRRDDLRCEGPRPSGTMVPTYDVTTAVKPRDV